MFHEADLVDFDILITITSRLLNMTIDFWLCLFIIKSYSQKDIF